MSDTHTLKKDQTQKKQEQYLIQHPSFTSRQDTVHTALLTMHIGGRCWTSDTQGMQMQCEVREQNIKKIVAKKKKSKKKIKKLKIQLLYALRCRNGVSQ